MENKLGQLLAPDYDLTFADLVYLLNLEDEESLGRLYDRAYQVKLAQVGNRVFFRGLIEFSNLCRKNCYYCGIRRDNDKVERYEMTLAEILEAARFAYENGYGSVVLQAGERGDANYVSFVEEILREIKNLSSGELGITLSLGEQSRETLERWYDAGGHRYLLRIETSSRELYRKLHPEGHDFDARLQTLRDLTAIGYQVGTGVMIGLPFQTREDLARDLVFFREWDVAMIGMGPYVIHRDTPLGTVCEEGKVAIGNSDEQLRLALKMIALARIYLKDVNIAATTALQALQADGREQGLLAGANIIMPNITQVKYKTAYQLYEGKPCLEEDAIHCRGCLEARIGAIGEEIAYGKWGDSPHFRKAGQTGRS
jgi:biotin synthase